MAIQEILGPLVQSITSTTSSLDYVEYFFIMVLESALILMLSEVIMPFSSLRLELPGVF
jgi:membrane protein DedA with SNARE-associated domain